jgi:WD domain, G-beta repeat
MASRRPGLWWAARAGAATAFCLAGAVAGAGLYFGNLAYVNTAASQQRAIASQQRDQVIRNQIVAEAEQLSATDPSLAAQLLLTAYRMDPSQDLASRLISTENQPLSTSKNVGSPVYSVAFSPDGKTLATGGGGTVTLWDLSDPARPRQLGQPLTAGSGNTVRSVAFSPNGTTLATGESGGIAQIWNLDVSYAISRICATGTLTPQQWHQYIPGLPYDPPCPKLPVSQTIS